VIRTVRAFLLSCLAAALLTAAPADPPKKPRLVLAIVIDQFRYDYLLRFRSDYTAGLAHLLRDGAVFTDAHYIHAATLTAVGHSTFLSGATPSVSGIIGNEWYDRDSGQTVTSVSDPQTKVVGGVPNAPGSSPRRLLVSTVGDEVKIRDAESKVIGVSIKDRAAILPSGHMADGAYWYDDESHHWVTSTYYRADLPDWVKKINDEKAYQRYVGAQWLPFDAPNDPAKALCTMVAGAALRYCGSIEATPWANEMIEDFAERAIANEGLGRHAGTDILTVSFSANDYVGHRVGPDDPAVRDISIRTDRLLGKLFDYADKTVGAGNTLVALTADHGVAPVPEVNQARHMPGGRLAQARVSKSITDALTQRFGPGEWLVAGGSATMPYLNLETIRSHNLDPAVVESAAAAAALTVEHIARVATWHELRDGAVQQDAIGRAMTMSFYGPRSGSLYIVPEPYYMFDATGTTHGTPYDYDTHVPLIFLGPGIKPGVYDRNVAINDVAPTLAALLGVEQPSGSVGRILSELF
jgi:predicted AlkP superfamily pyrophosphatase or phosphodiesterase